LQASVFYDWEREKPQFIFAVVWKEITSGFVAVKKFCEKSGLLATGCMKMRVMSFKCYFLS